MYCQAEAGWWDDSVARHFSDLDAARGVASRLCVAVSTLEVQALTLATGERQRLALVRAWLLSPRVLLLDEPAAALDDDATLLIDQERQRFLHSGGRMLRI